MIPKAHNPNWDFFCLNGVVQAITSSDVEDKIIYTLYIFQTFNTLRKEKESLIRRKKKCTLKDSCKSWLGFYGSFKHNDVSSIYMNMLFKFYKRQTLSIKGICQLFLIATNLNRQIVNIFSKSLHLNQYDFNWYYKERNKLTLTNYRNLGPKWKLWL